MESNIGIMDSNRILKYVETKLLNNWILVVGNTGFYSVIENELYTPGTDANSYFELISGGFGSHIFSFVLIKKTDEFGSFFNIDDNLDNIIAIEMLESGPAGYKSKTIEYNHKSKNFREFVLEFAYSFVNWYYELTTTGNAIPIELNDLTKNFVKNKNKPKKAKRKPLVKSIRHEVFKRDNYKCVECGATNKEATLHVDHIIPVAQGGSDELDNLQTLCESCNLAKSNRAWEGGINQQNEGI